MKVDAKQAHFCSRWLQLLDLTYSQAEKCHVISLLLIHMSSPLPLPFLTNSPVNHHKARSTSMSSPTTPQVLIMTLPCTEFSLMLHLTRWSPSTIFEYLKISSRHFNLIASRKSSDMSHMTAGKKTAQLRLNQRQNLLLVLVTCWCVQGKKDWHDVSSADGHDCAQY